MSGNKAIVILARPFLGDLPGQQSVSRTVVVSLLITLLLLALLLLNANVPGHHDADYVILPAGVSSRGPVA